MSEEAWPEILKAAKDLDPQVRTYIAYLMPKAGERSVPELARMLAEDNDVNVRVTAAAMLGQIGEKAQSALPQILDAVESESAGVELKH